MANEVLRRQEDLSADQIKELKDKFSIQNDATHVFAGRTCAAIAIGIVKDGEGREVKTGDGSYSEELRLKLVGMYAAEAAMVLSRALALPDEQWLEGTLTPLDFWTAAQELELQDQTEVING